MSEQTICLLNDSFPPVIDGVANAVVNYAQALHDKGDRALVLTPAVPGADDSAFPFPVLRYPSIDTRKRLGYVTGYPFSPQVAGQLQQARPALLHTHCPLTSCLLARSLRDAVDAPLVLTYHTKFDIEIEKALKGRLLQEGAVHALVQNIQACDEVWVVSRGAEDNLRSMGYEGTCVLMQNGVDIPRGRVSDAAIAEATSAYDLPAGVPMFLFVGRMMWYKGLRIILDALQQLQRSGQDFRMVFVGDGGDYDAVRAYARELGIMERCIFTGAIRSRETIRAWFSRTDLFLFPSTFDTNGLVVREAAACGTATVMVAGSCAAEGVTDGHNGFFIRENAASLAACLTQLCASPEAMRQVGACAQQELYLSWSEAVARARERYAIVIDNHRRGRCPKHDKPMDGFLKSQGELMDVLAAVEREHLALHRDLSAVHDRLREHRQALHQEIRDAGETVWSWFDRYL